MYVSRLLRILAPLVVVATVHIPAHASRMIPVPVQDRLRGAERVVVGAVAGSAANWETNEFGDQVIVTRVTIQVEEAIKGAAAKTVVLQMEGGTVGDVTLEVSSLPKLAPGDRAVFFLEKDRRGRYVPHLKGQGILPLDARNRVRGSSLTVDAIRSMMLTAGVPAVQQ